MNEEGEVVGEDTVETALVESGDVVKVISYYIINLFCNNDNNNNNNKSKKLDNNKYNKNMFSNHR